MKLITLWEHCSLLKVHFLEKKGFTYEKSENKIKIYVFKMLLNILITQDTVI